MKFRDFAPFLSFTVFIILAACGAQPAAQTEAPQAAPVPVSATEPAATPALEAAPTENSPILFRIVKPDGSAFDVTLAAVKDLKLAELTVEGKVQEGPMLKDVLGLAGITEFNEVTLSGSSAPVTLTFAQVDTNTILDFSNRGTMKLATTYIPKAEWTKDISEIVVK